MKHVFVRAKSFSCAHRYWQKKFTEEQNYEIFGPCANPYGHGHNYKLVIYISGEIDPDTGMILNLVEVDKILDSCIAELDHRHLNHEVDYFKDHIPTCEEIANYLSTKLIKQIENHKALKLEKICLYETDDIWSEIWY